VLGVQYQVVADYVEQQKERGKEVDLGTVNGIYVAAVTPESSADDAGIKEGDVITHIDKMEITKSGELQEALATHRPGDKVKVTYLRDKKVSTVTVTLKNAQGTTAVLSKVDQDKMGIALEELSARDKQALNLTHGLVVKHLREGKMKQAGIVKGLILLQVNDRQLRTVADWDEAVKEANLSTDRVLWIRAKTQSGLNKSFTVELDEK
jgi:S1-C subfamily serine protease